MKRKMVWIGIPWLLGLFLAVSCQLSVVMCLLPAAWMLLGAFRLFRQIPAKEALCAGGAMGLAVGAVLLYTALVCQPVMEYDGKITTFSGSVTQVTEYDGDRAQYQVKGAFADGTRAKVLVYTDDLGAQYGDTLQIAGPFSVPEASYLWNGASYYRSKGIFLQADSDASVRLPPIVFGSHHDAVPDGGMFDGALGVLIATEILETLQENGMKTRHPLGLVSFTGEEPNPFQVSTLGSKVLSGRLTRADLERLRNRIDGSDLQSCMQQIGGDITKADDIRIQPEQIRAFLECHIEQGCRLEEKGLHTASVSCITGIYR